MHDKKPADLDVSGKRPEHDLHAFAIGQTDAEPFAAAGMVAGDLDAAAGKGQPPYPLGQAGDAQTSLDDLQAAAFLQQEVRGGDAQAVEFQFAISSALARVAASTAMPTSSAVVSGT